MDGPLNPDILRFTEHPRHLLVLDDTSAHPIHPEGSVVSTSSTETILHLPLDETWAVRIPRKDTPQTKALLGLTRRLILQTRRRKTLARLLLGHTRNNLSAPWSRRLFTSPPPLGLAVGAGPSLDRHLGLLRRLQDHALIVCGITALRPLLHAGIRPHIVACPDIQIHAVRHLPLPHTIPEKTLLLADPAVHPAILRNWPGPVQAVDCGSPFAALLRPDIASHGTADLCLAFLLTTAAPTIILCGFDASRPFDQSHARGTAALTTALSRTSRLRSAPAPSPGLHRITPRTYTNPLLEASAEAIRNRIASAPPEVLFLGLDTPDLHPRLHSINPADIPRNTEAPEFRDAPDEETRARLRELWLDATREARQWLSAEATPRNTLLALIRWVLPNHPLPAPTDAGHPAVRIAAILVGPPPTPPPDSSHPPPHPTTHPETSGPNMRTGTAEKD